MHFTGQQKIRATMPEIWAFFMDPDKVAQCAPGFKSMEVLGPDHFKPTLSVGVGPVRATFTLDVQLSEMHEPDHAVMTARGSAAGSAVEVRAAVSLTPESDEITDLNYDAQVNVSGTLASVGSRLMEGTANKLTAQFFNCARTKLEA